MRFDFRISPNCDEQSDIKKPAFITKYGMFGFIRMPFRLSGAPSSFQKAMDKILKPVLGKGVSVYLDDIIIGSETFEQHVKALEQVFQLLQGAGLTVNLEKCKFGRKELQYLG